MTSIEWTDKTWNPIVGCSIVSPGCTNCYAMKMAGRLSVIGHSAHYKGTTKRVNGNTVWTGKLALAPESTLLEPLRRKKPATYFVNSMGDLFHEDCPDEWIDRVFAVMALCPQHTFQVLTKRAERMSAYCSQLIKKIGPQELPTPYSAALRLWFLMPKVDARATGCLPPAWPLPNVWLGVSTEDQKHADERIPLLLQTPAAVRFISAEPLLGPIDLTRITTEHLVTDALRPCALVAGRRLDWIIVGGESGHGARPMHPKWARDIRDECAEAGVPFFFKQWGEYLPVGQSLSGCGKVHGATAVKPGRMKLHYGGAPQQAPKCAFAERGVEFASTTDGRLTFRVGKRNAGRLLDGKEHNAFPEVRHA